MTILRLLRKSDFRPEQIAYIAAAYEDPPRERISVFIQRLTAT